MDLGKVMSLLFHMLSRLVISFLPSSKHLLIPWLQSPSAVILEPKKIQSVTVSIVSPSICHEVMGPDAMILVFCMLSFKPTFSLSSFTFIKRLFRSCSLSAIHKCWKVGYANYSGAFRCFYFLIWYVTHYDYKFLNAKLHPESKWIATLHNKILILCFVHF